MNDEFKELLRHRTDHVVVPPLADGARRRGRKLGRVRATAAGAAAVAVVVGAAGGYLAMQPTAAESVDGQAADGTGGGVVTGSVAPWTSLPDRLVYGGWSAADGNDIVAVVDGAESERITLPFHTAQGGAGEPWAVSPNGRNISGVTDDGLRIGAVDNAQPPLAYGSENLCAIQTWSPDSAQVLVGECDGDTVTLVIVDAQTGEVDFTIDDTGIPVQADDRHAESALWTSDGEHVVWGSAHGEYTIANPDGSGREPFDAGEAAVEAAVGPRDGQHEAVSDNISAVSADGTLVCHRVEQYATGKDGETLAGTETPKSDIGMCNSVINTRTGELVDIPDPVSSSVVAIGPEGELLVTTSVEDENQLEIDGHELRLLSADGTEVDSVREPYEVETLGLTLRSFSD